jgi:hypothetical protein
MSLSLFLGGHLLFNLTPRTDLQPAAHPAQRLGGSDGGFRAAYRTLDRFSRAIWGDGKLRQREDLGRNYFGPNDGLGFWLSFAFHETTRSKTTVY